MKKTPSASPALSWPALVAALGARFDDTRLLALAQQFGVRTPLKSSTDGDSTQHFTVKKPCLEVAWTHLLRTRATYPPQKENRRYVGYVSTIWFELGEVAGLPVGVGPDSTFEALGKLPGAAVHQNRLGRRRVELPVAGCILPAVLVCDLEESTGRLESRARIQIVSANAYAYLRSEVVSFAFEPWHPSWPRAQADLSIGMLMAWAIQRGEASDALQRAYPAQIEAVRTRRMTGRDFLHACAYADEVWSTDFAPSLEPFLHRYVYNLCHRNSSPFGKKDRCNPEDDFVGVFGPYFPEGALRAADDWANHDRFAQLLDARLRDWDATALETEISPEQARSLKLSYLKLAKTLEALPAPAALGK